MLDDFKWRLIAEPGMLKHSTRTQSVMHDNRKHSGHGTVNSSVHTGIQKAMIESKARATKDKLASSRAAPDILDGVGEAVEDVSAVDWLSETAELIRFELGDPVGALPWAPEAGSVGEGAVPLADPVGLPLELISVAAGDPVARALVPLGELEEESDGEFGPPAEEVVVAADEPEGDVFSASPVGQSVTDSLLVPCQIALTNSILINIEQGIHILQECISQQPAILDHRVAIYIAGADTIRIWADPILGRDVVGDARESNCDGFCS